MGDLTLIFWNVEHGSATYMNTPNGKVILFDLGVTRHGRNTLFSPLQHISRSYNVSYIDELVVTHPDLDHIEDIVNIDKFGINNVLFPKGIHREMQGNPQRKRRPLPRRIQTARAKLHLLEPRSPHRRTV